MASFRFSVKIFFKNSCSKWLPGVLALRVCWAPSDGEVGDATLRPEQLNITRRRRRPSDRATLISKTN